MMLQAPMPTGHPLADTVAQYVWLLPVLPLLGFVLNGALSMHGRREARPRRSVGAGHGAHDAHAEAQAPAPIMTDAHIAHTTTTRSSGTGTRRW